MSRRPAIHWPDGARLAVIPCVALETWPEDVGAPNSLNMSHRRPLPANARFANEFLTYAKSQPGVWFARCIDVARHWLDHYREAHLERWPNALRLVDPPYVSHASVHP
jgi:hypothetical protein